MCLVPILSRNPPTRLQVCNMLSGQPEEWAGRADRKAGRQEGRKKEEEDSSKFHQDFFQRAGPRPRSEKGETAREGEKERERGREREGIEREKLRGKKVRKRKERPPPPDQFFQGKCIGN